VALRGQDDVVAASARQCLGNDLFALTRRVDVGGVDEVDTGIQRAVDDADALVVVTVAEAPEHHGAEAQVRDLHTCVSERAVGHEANVLVVEPATSRRFTVLVSALLA
jgi:hypothetical protein